LLRQNKIGIYQRFHQLTIIAGAHSFYIVLNPVGGKNIVGIR
jgi:hypothetical protein